MAWPTGSVSTANLDQGSDSPAQARSDLKTLVDKVNDMIQARAAADGVASLDGSGKVPQGQLPLTKAFNGIFVDGTPGSGKTWTVPAGVTRVRVTCVGGGGGGGYTSVGTGGDHGGGGGGGGVAVKEFVVVPGSDFSYQVGAKGAGAPNTSDGDGSDGDESNATSPADATPASHTVRAFGGLKGQGPPNRFGGGGGGASGTDLGLPGGAGASGASRGGAGGGNMFTGGAAGATGYGGAGGFGSGGGTSAFDGLDGFVMFEW